MNQKQCEKCHSIYDGNMNECPNCSKQYNIKNPFINSQIMNDDSNSFNDQNNNQTNLNADYNDKFKEIMEIKNIPQKQSNNKIIIEQKPENNIEPKKEIINKNRNIKKKQEASYFSYILLIVGMILLFIIILSTLNEFNLIIFSHYVLSVLMFIIAFNLTYNDNKIGYLFSLIGSISMILMLFENDYINMVIGVYLFTSSLLYLIKK